MRNLFIGLALLAGMPASAQLLTVTGMEQVKTPLKVSQAAISPDGTYVVAETYDDNKLWQVPMSDGAVEKCIAEQGSMLSLSFTPDSKGVVYVREFADANHLRYKEVRSVDLQTMQTRQLHAPTRSLNGISVCGDEVTVVDNNIATKVRRGEKSLSQPTVSIYYGQLMLTRDGKTIPLNPNGREGCSYMWPSISPDGSRVLYYLGGTGAYVCNLDGSNVVSLGELRAPCWIDNNMVVGMQDRDNGRFVTSSAIIAANLQGERQVLVPEDFIAMYPTVSADGKTIVFTAREGAIYKLNLK